MSGAACPNAECALGAAWRSVTYRATTPGSKNAGRASGQGRRRRRCNRLPGARRPPLPRDRVSSIRPETYCEPERRGLRREAQRGVVAVALDHQLVAEQQLRAARKLHRVGGGDVSCLKGVDCGEVETEAAWYQSQFVVKAAVWASYQSEHRHGKLRAQP